LVEEIYGVIMPKRIKWDRQELTFLLDKSSYYPPTILTKRLNQWNKRRGMLHKRTLTAVKLVLKRNKKSWSPIDDNMSRSEWAKQLGVSTGRLLTWVKLGYVTAVAISSHRTAISVVDMENLFKSKPNLFKGANPEAIAYYFGDDAHLLIESSSGKSDIIKARPIIRADNGFIYPSIYKAAKELGMSTRTIWREVRKQDGWLRYYVT
jgi:hypothetical protein